MRYLNRVFVIAVLALLACPGWAAELPDQYMAPDPICQTLYDTYIVRPTMDGSGLIISASNIIAARGRTTGFWKQVLQGLDEAKDEWDEARYVRILGKMLSTDAQGREIRESDKADQVQHCPGVYLPKEVVSELIDRAQKSKNTSLDAYVIALCRARDTRAKDLFLNVLKQNDMDISIQFHAALGLAELGDSTGMDWLIAHSDDDNSAKTVHFALPQRIPDHGISTCTIAALKDLSGEKTLKTKAEFTKWWKTSAKDWSPKDHVYLEDR